MRSLCCLLIFASTTATAALADTVDAYSDLSLFEAVTSTTLSDNFVSSGVSYQGLHYTYGPITYALTSSSYPSLVSPGIYIDNDVPGYGNSVVSSGAAYVSADTINGSPVSEQLSFAATNAVGLVLGNYYGAETLTITLGGESFEFTVPKGSGETIFAGFTSLNSFDELTIQGTSKEVDVVQAYYGTGPLTTTPASVTPEPSSFLLLGTGLLGVAGALRKRYA